MKLERRSGLWIVVGMIVLLLTVLFWDYSPALPVKPGMTAPEVTKILGKPHGGGDIRLSGVGRYYWSVPDGTMSVVFQDGVAVGASHDFDATASGSIRQWLRTHLGI